MSNSILFEPPKPDFEAIIDHGFVEPTIAYEDYFYLGATKIPDEIIMPSGQYLKHLVTKEYQNKGYETFGCTGFGTNNAVEIISKVKYPQDEEMNNSDRDINILAGNTPEGNSPQNPAEALRKYGVCKENTLPFKKGMTWLEFHNKDDVNNQVVKERGEWLARYKFMHEWINTTPIRLMEGLQRSPIGISVLAWKMRNGKYYKNRGERDNHWCVLVGYEENKCWYVFDTYDNFIKTLEWDYDFGYAKKYYLAKQETYDIPNNINQEIMKTLKSRTDNRVFIKSNTETNTLLWLGGKNGDETYTKLKKHGLVSLSPDEIIDDALLPSYTIDGGIVKVDYNPEEERVNWFVNFIKSITGRK